MQLRITYLLLAFIIICFSVCIVSAAPSILSTVQSGSLEIIAPTFDTIPQSANFDFYWHVFNTTELLTNTSTTCTYHLYSKFAKGEHIYTQNPVTKFVNDRDFEVGIAGGNFTKTGEYCDLIECNTSTQTGGLERCFEVSTNGYAPMDSGPALNMLMLVMIILSTAIGFFIVGSMTRQPIIKTILIGLGCITMAMMIFFGMAFVQDNFITYQGNNNVYTNYYNFWWFMIITITMTGMAVFVWITVHSIKGIAAKQNFHEVD